MGFSGQADFNIMGHLGLMVGPSPAFAQSGKNSGSKRHGNGSNEMHQQQQMAVGQGYNPMAVPEISPF